MPQTYVIGDIHGAYKALKQCLERSEFDYESDHLICLGDVCDGWPETKSCVDELLKIKKLTYILGNHDLWAIRWMKANIMDNLWLSQGGSATVSSYAEGIPLAHVTFFDKGVPYFVVDNKLFVHAGFDPRRPLEQQDIQTFSWDRSLVQKAWELLVHEKTLKLTTYDEVYIGHTPIPFHRPIQSCEIWMMDTGAGWSGVLSMMNIHTKEVFISDQVPLLYPEFEGRMKKK